MKKFVLLICLFFACPFYSYAYTENISNIDKNNHSEILILDTDLPSIENDLVWSRLNREIKVDNRIIYILILLFIIVFLVLVLTIILVRKYIKV